jgi:iron complex outermembrane receptor protein
MLKKISLFFLFMVLCLISTIAFSQARKITGVVRDSVGYPIVGASVSVKNYKNGANTDATGHFQINIAPGAKTLTISSVGYETKEITLGLEKDFMISLSASKNSLQDVVVVGFGRRAESKKLSYAVSTVKGSEIAETNTPNPVNALQGKVPGLYMSQVAGGPQTSSRILLRGIADITNGGNNSPLFVIDGVLIQPSLTNTGGEGNEQDFGNELKNINADDIENISVLKGSAATALYGSKAQNGVIIITSKKGFARKGVGISFTQQYSTEHPYGGGDFQSEYGAGSNPAYLNPDPTQSNTVPNGGASNYAGLVSFGKKFDGSTVTDIDGRSVKWEAHDPLHVYENGYTYNTNIAVAGGDENSTFRLSWSNMANKGTLPTMSYGRNTFTLRATHKIGSLIDIDASVSYLTNKVNNPNAQNSSSRSMFNAFLFSIPRSYDIDYYKTHYLDPVNGGLNIAESNLYGNMGNGYSLSYFLYQLYYWNKVRAENTFRPNLDITLHFTPWLKLLLRGNLYLTNNKQETKYWGDGSGFAGNAGLFQDLSNQYSVTFGNYQNTRFQALLTADRKLGKDITANFNAGGEIYNEKYDGSYITLNGLNTPGYFNVSNYVSKNNVSYGQTNADTYRNVSFYAFGDFGWKDQLFLNWSERLEYSSALVFPNGTGHNVYQYPSIGLSWLLDKTFNLPGYISSARLRASFANTGKDVTAWAISSDLNTYTYSGTYTNAQNGSTPPLYGFGSSQVVDPNLKPQRSGEYELGFNLQFLNNRVGVDASVFNKETYNEIATKGFATQSGSSGELMNVGHIRNRGIEVQLTGAPIRTKNFSWSSTLNYSMYRNKIVSFATTSPYITLESQYFTEVRAYIGSAYGDIYSYNSFLPYQAFDANGNKMADPNNGKHVIFNSGTWRYEPVSYAGGNYDNSARKIGNINPNFLWSWSNNFTYKNFFAGFMIDGRVGGKILSFSEKYGVGSGAFKSSLHGRDAAHGGVQYSGVDDNGKQGTWNDGIILDGVFAQGSTSTITGHDIGGMTFKDAVTKGEAQPEPAADYYVAAYGSWSRGIADLNTFDNTWVSLRQVSIGYTLPKTLSQRLKLSNTRISLVGRNLLYLYNGMGDHVNPEGIFNNRASSAFEFGAGPSTRSIGIDFNTNF